MKRNYPVLIFILACMAVLSGKLTAGVSFAGRVGISFFYKNYAFFKVWWQAAIIFMLVMLLVFTLIYFIDKRLHGIKKQAVSAILLLLFLAGFYFTYQDFRQSLSHRLLGERFHIGVYLYWTGMCLTDLFFMVTQRPEKIIL